MLILNECEKMFRSRGVRRSRTIRVFGPLSRTVFRDDYFFRRLGLGRPFPRTEIWDFAGTLRGEGRFSFGFRPGSSALDRHPEKALSRAYRL